LRDRPEDIPDIVWHFVREFGARMGKTFEEIHGPSLAALQRHSWPGNIRELRNVVERAMILAEGPVLQIPTPSVGESIPEGPITLDEVQRRHILHVLERTGWKIRGPRGAAAILGLKPTTLESRIKKLGIQRPQGSSDIS
jgi:DNA-binding NtrC family response regulator